MHVFVIPSWYPHRCYPLEGAFIRDQSEAVAGLRPDWKVSIARWGQGVGFLSPAHFLHSPACTWETLVAPRSGQNPLAGNAIEWIERVPTWSERFKGGNRNRLLEACRRLLARATQEFGEVSVLHAHVSYPAGWIAWRLSEETGIPFVITEHMGPFPLPVYRTGDGKLRPEIREPLARAHARIAVSPSLARRIESFGLSPVVVVPNPVDERRFQVVERKPDAPFQFFTLCGMEFAKGIDDLIDAIALLLPRLDEAQRARLRFVLGGEGPALGSFQDHARRAGVAGWIEWLGLVPYQRAPNLYAESDCFVLPSRHESFGIVLVEAQASGRPSIATRSGGPESIVTGDTGVLIDPGRPDQLADALERMLTEARRYDPQRIRDAFLGRFSRPAVVTELESVYRGVVGSAAPPVRQAAP
jgi:glycosyltransferase involved in cell wall biosynthesis